MPDYSNDDFGQPVDPRRGRSLRLDQQGAMPVAGQEMRRHLLRAGFATELGGLQDVDLDTDAPEEDQALIWDGTKWVPGSGGSSPSGSITTSGYTMTTERLLGRSTAATPGAIEELQVGGGLQISGGALSFLTGVKGDVTLSGDAGTYTVTQTTLAAVRGLTPVADQLPYWTGATTAANTAITSLGRSIIASTGDQDAQDRIGLNSELGDVDFNDLCDATASSAGYSKSNSGSGSGVTQGWPFINSTTKAVGVMMLESGTTTSGYAALHTWNNVLCFDTGTAFTYEARLITETLSDATDEYRVEFGFGDNWGSTSWPTDSTVFRYDRATDGANWQCITRASGSETKTDSGVAVNAGTTGTMQTLSIVVAEDGSSVAFKIGESTVATHTTRIPTSSGRLGYGAAIRKSAGTTEVRVGIDWTRFTTKRTAAR